MMTNVGVIDAALRLILGLILIDLGSDRFDSLLGDLLGWLVLFVGVALAGTALLRHCPIYARIGVTSCAPYAPDDRR
jgi:hypothetical protein